VITGFRIHLAGAQGYYGVTPDPAAYAKALSSGVVVSALTGEQKFMDHIASGKVGHAGTMNGNGIALAATKVTLESLIRKETPGYDELLERGDPVAPRNREIAPRSRARGRHVGLWLCFSTLIHVQSRAQLARHAG
jgi:glutamate-1-semialdehyde 2,1-aminomutase